MPKILYVEDDKDLSFLIKDQLELNGYDVVLCNDGNKALKAIKNEKFDICILDVMLPEVDGFIIAKKIRTQNIHIPIIFLTAKAMLDDRLRGFELGGDDYLTKPFDTEELMYKIKVFTKRKEIIEEYLDKKYIFGKYFFDPENLTLGLDGKPNRLTIREAEVLLMLSKNVNQLVKRDDLLMLIWGKRDYFLGRSLDVFISRLRKYLSEDKSITIENIHGVGFRLSVPE